mmetsp:Transcript_7346/g.10780  ORF Transcript_7346/g.10780 Transcript_7346/m.10780 type:complete len:250 (+) Transcript_7346:348-1097(+)
MIFQNTTNTTSRSTKRGVEHVDISCLLGRSIRVLHLLTTTGSNTTCLKVCTIGTRHKFPIRLLTGEPSFQIILFDSSIIQFTTDDTNNTISNSKRIIKFLGSCQHAFLFGLREFKVIHGQTKLFNLFKLMNTKDTTNVLSRRPRFLSETGRNTSISQGKLLLFDPFSFMIGTQGLFGSGNQILFRHSIGIIRLTSHFVQLFIKVFQLSNTRHDILIHKEGWLYNIISTFAQKGDTIIDNGLIEQDTGIR